MHWLYWLLGFVLFFSFLFAVLSYSLYWYETANQKNDRISFGLLLLGMLDSTLGVVFLALTYPLGRLKWVREPAAPGKNGPVIICLHGLFHNPSAWLLVRFRLRRAGFANCYCPAYRSFTNDIPGALEELTPKIEAILKRHPEQGIIFLGHSLGGLLSLGLGSKNNFWPTQLIITMGTPFRGSKMAVFGLSRLARSLHPDSPELETLRSGIDWDTSIPGMALYTATDNMVLPRSSLKAPPQKWELHETGPISHMGMLWNKKAAKKIIDSILDIQTGK